MSDIQSTDSGADFQWYHRLLDRKNTMRSSAIFLLVLRKAQKFRSPSVSGIESSSNMLSGAFEVFVHILLKAGVSPCRRRVKRKQLDTGIPHF